MTFWHDSYAPITSVIGFVRAPLDDAVVALKGWRTEIHGSATALSLDGGLLPNISRLEPLTLAARPRELLVATTNPEWTALFDCGANGGDPVSSVGYLSQVMLVQGAVICCILPAPSDDKEPGRYGALQLELYGPFKTEFLNYVRTISLTQDGSRWRFDANGTVQAFEDLEAYGRRKARDRFTVQMLDKYAHELGLDPFNPDFYKGPSALVSNPSGIGTLHPSLTLALAQRRLGIRPQP